MWLLTLLDAHPTLVICVAAICVVWSFIIILVQTIGCTQLFRFYSSTPEPAASLSLPLSEIPHITIIRPCKGLEPQLYECLSSTFHQTYPASKLSIHLCASSRSDPAYPTLLRLLQDFPNHDARIFIEEEDPNLQSNAGNNLGPNPKIRNMSRAYHEAKGELIWIIDCNVWVSRGVAGRMVDKLMGFASNGQRAMPYKLVHQLPLVVDGVGASVGEEARGVLTGGSAPDTKVATHWDNKPQRKWGGLLRTAGGRLEEQFISCAHDKFYTAINTVAVAPCIVGKSNMFRRAHLDYLTTNSSNNYAPGIDYFSHNICEDHLIGDLLWRKKVPEQLRGEKIGNHKLLLGDTCIQPMAMMSLYGYIDRRVRWLRVRKWTVTLATFVEPGVESFLCCFYAAFALTHLPWFYTTFKLPTSLSAFFLYWALGIIAWATLDFWTYNKLHSVASVELDEHTPSFARPSNMGSVRGRRRPFREWAAAWLGREVLALPIWVYACLGGTTVQWRSKRFWVGVDMMVHEIPDVQEPSTSKERTGLLSRNNSDERIMEGNGIMSVRSNGGLTNANANGNGNAKTRTS